MLMKTLEKPSIKRLVGAFIVLMLLLSGCLKSLQPFYTSEDLIPSTAFKGIFSSKGMSWVILPAYALDDEIIKRDKDRLSSAFGSDLDIEADISFSRSDSMSTSVNVKIDSTNSAEEKAEKAVNTINQIKQMFEADPSTLELELADSTFGSVSEKGALAYLGVLARFESDSLAQVFYQNPTAIEMDEDFEELYVAAFFVLEGETFLDLTPFEILGNSSFLGRHRMPVHTLSRVERTDQGLRLRFIDGSKVNDLIENDRIRIQYERYEKFGSGLDESESETVLTATTEALQAFMKRYVVGNDDLLSNSSSYTLKRVTR